MSMRNMCDAHFFQKENTWIPINLIVTHTSNNFNVKRKKKKEKAYPKLGNFIAWTLVGNQSKMDKLCEKVNWGVGMTFFFGWEIENDIIIYSYGKPLFNDDKHNISYGS